MAEAIEQFKAEKVEKKELEEAQQKNVAAFKRQKRELKRRKWVDWRNDDDEEGETKRAAFDPAERIKRKKHAVILGYSGANYYGMQRNPGQATIEEELLKAMFKHKWITEDSYKQSQVACFQRAARTDKGVSAARQVVSLKMPETYDIDALNADLPENIRVFGVRRVTKGFNSKDQCNARTYAYTLPTIALAPYQAQLPELQDFRVGDETVKQLKELLQKYEGTKNFHNFTSRKSFIEPSSKRYIIEFGCSEPYYSPQGVEFVRLQVKGQSFMLHQIRKMVGTVLAIVRGNTSLNTLERAFTEERLTLPMAPGLGLVLDTVHYERYNNRYSKDGIHEPLVWPEKEQEIKDFAEKYIYANIYKTEFEEKPMLAWLQLLDIHAYEPKEEDAKDSKQKSEDEDDNDE